MNQVHIIRIPILPMNMVNAYLLKGPDGCILIDAGIPGSEKKIEDVLTRNKLTFKDIKLIVITHAHVDHAGSAALIRERSGAPILAHAGDASHYSQEKPMTFCPTGRFGRWFLKTGFIRQPYVGFEPNIWVDQHDVVDLQRYGVPGIVTSTPGHTAGSISVKLASHEALVGDLIASGIGLGGIMSTGRAIRPPFEDDPRAVAHELIRLLESGVDTFYLGHGAPLQAREVHRHAQSLLSLP